MSFLLLEDGSSKLLLEDGSSRLLLEDGSTVVSFVPAPAQRRVQRPPGTARARTTKFAPAQSIPPLAPHVVRPARGVRAARRPRRPVQIVPAQQNPPLTPAAYHQTRTVRGWRRVTGQYRSPIPPQRNPPFPVAAVKQARALRGWLRRPGRPVFVVPSQAPPPNPAITFNPSQRRIVRPFLRKAHPVETVPPQRNPPIVLPPARKRTVRWQLRKARPVEVVPTAPTAPAFIPAVLRSRRVLAAFTRPRRRDVTHGQPVPVPLPQRRARIAVPVARSRRRDVTPAQPAPVNPAFVHRPTQARRLRGWLRRAGRFVIPWPITVTPDVTDNLAAVVDLRAMHAALLNPTHDADLLNPTHAVTASDTHDVTGLSVTNQAGDVQI